MELARLLAGEGHRIFTLEEARKLAPKVGIKQAYLPEALYHLIQGGWIAGIKRGLYSLSGPLAGGNPVHEFEIASALVPNCAISHWSALHHHGLTEQIPRKVFATTTRETWVPYVRGGGSKGGYPVGKTRYQFIRVIPGRFFGYEKVWIGEASIRMTDPERTLLDGLAMPQYYGGFGEVLNAFGLHKEKLDLGKILGYALRLDVAVAKRLGWIMEKRNMGRGSLERLAKISSPAFHKLDPTRPSEGPHNKRWMIIDNLSGKGGL
jgi:predicted transcriptional regulator of viral defense system